MDDPTCAEDAPDTNGLAETPLDALALMLRAHEMIHGDAIAQERERRRLERHTVPDNRHERRKRAAINRGKDRRP